MVEDVSWRIPKKFIDINSQIAKEIKKKFPDFTFNISSNFKSAIQDYTANLIIAISNKYPEIKSLNSFLTRLVSNLNFNEYIKAIEKYKKEFQYLLNQGENILFLAEIYYSFVFISEVWNENNYEDLMNILPHEIQKGCFLSDGELLKEILNTTKEKINFYFFNSKNNIKEDTKNIIANIFFTNKSSIPIRFGHQVIPQFELHYTLMRINPNAKKQCDNLIKILLNNFGIRNDQIPTINNTDYAQIENSLASDNTNDDYISNNQALCGMLTDQIFLNDIELETFTENWCEKLKRCFKCFC